MITTARTTMMTRIVLSIPGISCAMKNPSEYFSVFHQVIEIELLDHGFTVGADLFGHGVDIHGIEGVKIILRTVGFGIFLGRFHHLGSLPAFTTGDRHRG